MQALALVLSNLLLLAAAADKAKAPSPELDAILDRVSSLEPAKQQEWLQHLKTRLDRATALSLPPSTAAKKKAQYESQLTQKAISRETLRELLRLADAREKAAIDVLTRQYRVQVYETFWSNQEAYKERQAALDRALEAWNASKKTPVEQERMVIWLDKALKSAMPDAKEPLPEEPEFDGVPKPKESKPKPKTPEEKPGTEKPGTEKPKDDKPAPEKPKTDGTKPEPKKPTDEPPEKPKDDVPAKEPGPQPADTTLTPNRAGGSPVVPRQPDDRPDESAAGGTNRPIPVELPRPESPVPRPDGSATGETGREPLAAAAVDPSLAAPVALESTSLEELAGLKPTVAYRPNVLGVPQPPHSVAAHAGADVPSGTLPPAAAPPRQTANGRTHVGPLPGVAGHGLNRELSLSLDTLSDVQVAPEPLLPPVHVNVVNLKARIAGCNLTLRELEIELDAEREWDAQSLRPLLERLRDLRQQQNDLAAIRELMPEADQDRVGRCEPLKLAVAQLGRRIFEARTRAGDTDAGTPATRQAELARLDALSRELAKLVP